MNEKFQQNLRKFLQSLEGLEFNNKLIFELEPMNECCALTKADSDVRIMCTPFWDGSNGISVEVQIDDEAEYEHQIDFPKIETDAQYLVFCKWYIEQLAIISGNYFEHKTIVYVHRA